MQRHEFSTSADPCASSHSMRSLVKSLVEPFAAGLAWRARKRHVREGILVLAYHNIRPPGERPTGEHSLHMPWRQFLDHLDVISAHADIVPLEDVCGSALERSRLRIAVTFDDAYAGAVDWAIPELVQRGIPATVFVAPGLLDGQSSWWDQMAETAGGTLSGQIRAHALGALGGRQELIESWARANRVPWAIAMPAWATGSSTAALAKAALLPGISMGSHSWSHPNLGALPPSELDLQLRKPLDWLQSQGIPHGGALAYPYGLATEATIEAASHAGYTCAFRVSGGFVPTPARAHNLPRLNVPAGLTPAGLKLRLAGRLIA